MTIRKSHTLSALRFLLPVLVACAAGSGVSRAQEAGAPTPVKLAEVRKIKAPVLLPDPDKLPKTAQGIDDAPVGAIVTESELLAYCMNVSNETERLREQLVKQRLNMAKQEVDVKLGELEKKIAELKGWLEKREKFLALANETMVAVFRQMRSDAAASQMMELNPLLSAAIMAKLPPKTASGIMMEMKPEAAARITELLASAKVTGESDDQSQLTQ